MNKPYIVYLRVSSSSQCLETQREVVLNYCQQNGIECVIMEEKMSSRKTRPAKQEMLKMLRSGEYMGLIIYKLDRLARSSSELLLDMEWFLSNQIELISVRDSLNLNTDMGKLQYHLLSMFCEFERSTITSRVKDGLARAKKVKKLGRPMGSKDTKQRKTDGYIKRELKKKLERMEQTTIPLNNSKFNKADSVKV